MSKRPAESAYSKLADGDSGASQRGVPKLSVTPSLWEGRCFAEVLHRNREDIRADSLDK